MEQLKPMTADSVREIVACVREVNPEVYLLQELTGEL